MMDWELWDDLTLGHSHCREHFYWRYSHPTWYFALRHSTHWWLIFEMMVHFETRLLKRLHVLRHSPLVGDGLWFFLEHSHFKWFILGHSHFIHNHVARGFWFIWIILRYFHFWQWELRLIDLLTYTRHDPSIVVDSDILRHNQDGEYFHWSIVTSDGLYWGIATSFTFM